MGAIFSILVVSCFMWSSALYLQLWFSSITTYSITSIAYNHHTDIPLIYLSNI